MKGLDNLLNTLSQQLGIASDVIQKNGMHYVAQYGKFKLIGNIALNIIGGIALAILFGALFCFLYSIIEKSINNKKLLNIIAIAMIFMTIVIFLMPLIIDLLEYNASPELYGLKELADLIKSK